jgi:hypothetical protein
MMLVVMIFEGFLGQIRLQGVIGVGEFGEGEAHDPCS